MTFFQRIKTPFTESPADEQARLQPRMRLIGELLQERREELGLELDEIGDMLRIKPTYLVALEQGRTRDLPGPTYAIGFVRAYSDFLGLDTEQVLARFRAEASGVTARPDLALPVPLGERSLPGGALVLVALILALCGYGIWYYLSTEERDRPARVAELPAALQRPQPPPTLVAPPSTVPIAGGNDSTAAAGQTSGSGLYGAATSPAAPAAAAPSPPPAPSSPSQAGAQPAQPGPAPAANLAPGALIDNMPRNAATNTPSSQPAPQVAQAPPQIASAAPAPAAAAAPATNAAGAGAGRITIKALNDCWIQVRSSDQSIVFSRVLKSGEVYTVPARTGLWLRTGNAGALEISVDGKTAPSIGAIGALRRDVALDPTELVAGTAVHG